MEENKDQQLLDKVNTLCLLLEEETSPIARGIYSAQLDFLISKMKREIDVQTIMEEYTKKREDIKQSFDSKLSLITSNKENTLKSIDRYSNELQRYSRYDISSPEFAFKTELKNAQGNLEEFLINLIIQNKSELASKIDQAYTYRKKYEKALSELKQLEEEGDFLKQDFEYEQSQNKQEETALIKQRQKKGNIFTRIFNAIKKGFKVAQGQPYVESPEIADIDRQIDEQNSIFEKDLQSISEQLNEEMKKAEHRYNEQIQACQDQFEQQKEFLEKLYGEQSEKAKSYHEPIIENFTKKKREKFIESLGVTDTVQNSQDIQGNIDDNLKTETNSSKSNVETTPNTDEKFEKIDYSILFYRDD